MSEKIVKYPCTICEKRCGSDAIRCSYCDGWVHRKCVPMDAALMKQWKRH